MRWAVAVALAVSAQGTAGCMDCTCDAQPIPIAGTPADFTAGPKETQTYSVSAPTRCDGDPLRYRIVVTALGATAVDWTWVEERLMPALRGMGVGPYYDRDRCRPEPRAAPTVVTYGFPQASTVAEVIARELSLDDRRGEVVVAVEEETLECAASCQREWP